MFDRITAILAAVVVGVIGVGTASTTQAQTCGGSYVVQRGESLSFIANDLYKDARKWTAIYQANIGVIGEDPERVEAGITLNLACINGLPQGLDNGLEF